MVKYIGVKEHNEWEGSSWFIFIPFEDNFQNMVKVQILRTVMDRIEKITWDDEDSILLLNSDYTLEEIEITQKIIGDTFDSYFGAINIMEEDLLSKLIAIFVGIYYEIVEFNGEVVNGVISETKGYQDLYKGGIMRL